MGIDGYLNQTATWRTYTDDPWGESEGHSDTQIRVRWEGGGRSIRDPQGGITVSEATVFTKARVEVGHSLIHPDDDPDAEGVKVWPVMSVSPRPGRNGVEHHREVLL
jgi:hypothetical protein